MWDINTFFVLIAGLLMVSFILILVIDFLPQFDTWQSRIHIGRFTDTSVWKQKLQQKSCLWLKKTPTIKLTDNSRLIVIDMLKGNYKRSSIQQWQEAALLLGLTEQFYTTGNATLKQQIDTFVNSKIDATGNWKNTPKEIDGVILAYAILNINWLEQDKYKPAYDAIWNLIQESIGVDGTVQYRSHASDYRFVDTIGFICPFLIHYGVKFDNPQAINLGIQQIKVFTTFGLFPNTFIPCHTYHVETKLPEGLFGWGRGLGWYAIGLIDAWSALPEQTDQKEELTKIVISFAKMALEFQNRNGSWNWIVSSTMSRPDSSTTATLAWFMANATQIEVIKQECQQAKEKALKYLMNVTRRDGAIDYSQGDTKAIGVYSQHFDILPFTQGFALRTVNRV